MAFPLWMRRILPTIKQQFHPRNGLFLDEEAFRYELARERLRVDRNGSILALLIIDLAGNRATIRDYDFLGRLLLRRLRKTDTFGFLSGRRVGVLLPNTSKSGAWNVASDICSIYPVGHDRPNCEVLLYPDESTLQHDGATIRDRETVKESVPTSIESLLTEATPVWKRASDILGAMIGLIALAPLMLICALAIKLTSRGPILFSQEREGFGGRCFQMYKFRTMRVNAERDQAALRDFNEQDGPAFKMSDDPRTTWVGGWLRRTSFDELPQLWNVLRGEMSLVGPRPLWTPEAKQCLPWQRQRLTVMPGLTCIWQVHGRSRVPFEEWMRMDVQYARQRSVFYDFELLVKTAPSIAFSRGPR